MDNLVYEIYETGVVSIDLKKCVVVPLPKISWILQKSASSTRPFNLSPRLHKIITLIIRQSIESKVQTLFSEDQFGFRRGRGTSEAILALRLVLDKTLQEGKDTYIALIDLEMAFDKVEWRQLFQVLKEAEIKYKDKMVV